MYLAKVKQTPKPTAIAITDLMSRDLSSIRWSISGAREASISSSFMFGLMPGPSRI